MFFFSVTIIFLLYSPSPLLSNLENYRQESREKATTTNDSALLVM
jgi:hypothetical protein